MATARARGRDRSVGCEPLSAHLRELMTSVKAEVVSVHVRSPSGAPQVLAQLRATNLDPGRGRVGCDIADVVETESLDDLLARGTVFVQSGDTRGTNVSLMFTPLTVGERIEGCICVGGARRRSWTCDDIATLIDARWVIEELVRRGKAPAGPDECGESELGEVVGVLGGMGPAASAAFLTTLVEATPASADQGHLHVLLDSNPQVPDRTAFLLGNGPDPRPALLDGARRLRAAGATCLVIPCNTANVFAPYLAQHVAMSIVPWISTAVAAVPGGGAVGILATEGTIRSQVYQRALARVGRSAVEPEPAERAVVMDAIYGPEGVKRGTLSPRARESLVAVARSLASRGAEQILLACTELPLLLGADADAWPVPATDPSLAMAQRLVKTLRTDRRLG